MKMKPSHSHRSLDSSNLAFSSRFVHGGVTNSNLTAHSKRAVSLAAGPMNPGSGGFQKKPYGRPSFSHSSRWSLYSRETRRSNTLKCQNKGGNRIRRVANGARVLILIFL
jgi:hypothetical protein